MSIIAYQYEADRFCIPCAIERFGHAAHDDYAAEYVRHETTCPMLDSNGIPCQPYPEDTEGNEISTVSSYDDWCNESEGGCSLDCATCGRNIREHSPSEHSYCDCGDGCSEGDCDACDDDRHDEDGDGPDNDREASYGCRCPHCEAAAAYICGMDDTVSVEQLVLPESSTVCSDPDCQNTYGHSSACRMRVTS